MPFVPFQVPIFTFEDFQEMDATEQEHAGEVIVFVVASRRRHDFIEASRRERR